jgi:hypothetical protein
MKTHYADDETLAHIAELERENADLRQQLATAPPSGLREGVLRAAEICDALRPEAYSTSARVMNYIVGECAKTLRAEAEKLPQSHVMVPEELLRSAQAHMVRTPEADAVSVELSRYVFGAAQEERK